MSPSGVLTATFDRASDRPVYKQIADHLRAAIDAGRLSEGDQLPSEAQLMEHYGVARMTVRNAISILHEEARVTSEHGRGVYVRRRPPVRRLASDRFARRHRKGGKAAFIAEAEHTGSRPTVDSLQVTKAVVPPAEIADRLKLGAKDRVTVRSRRYLMDALPTHCGRSRC